MWHGVWDAVTQITRWIHQPRLRCTRCSTQAVYCVVQRLDARVNMCPFLITHCLLLVTVAVAQIGRWMPQPRLLYTKCCPKVLYCALQSLKQDLPVSSPFHPLFIASHNYRNTYKSLDALVATSVHQNFVLKSFPVSSNFLVNYDRTYSSTG